MTKLRMGAERDDEGHGDADETAEKAHAQKVSMAVFLGECCVRNENECFENERHDRKSVRVVGPFWKFLGVDPIRD